MTDEPSDPRPNDKPHDQQASSEPMASKEASAEVTGDLEALLAENTDMRDKLLRTMADMENLRRRTEREKEDTARYAISNFARDVLTIGDNLRRVIEHVPGEAAEKDQALKGLLEGFTIGDRVLRPALVAVSKGGPKAAPTPKASTEAPEGNGFGPGAAANDDTPAKG